MKYAFIPETGLINGWLTDEQAIGRTDWTEIPPISVPPGKTNRWTGTEWEVVDIPADPWEIWQAKLDGTITDPVSGVRLKADEHSKSRFTEGLVLLGAGFTAGYITADTPFPIWDADGVSHATTAQEAQGILIRYGLAWAAMWQEFAP